MNDESELFRQINPKCVKDGTVTSQAFRPSKKDHHKLSCDNGEKITARESFILFTENYESAGVRAVKVVDAKNLDLTVDPDEIGRPSHASIIFSEMSGGAMKRKSKDLRDASDKYGWVHP